MDEWMDGWAALGRGRDTRTGSRRPASLHSAAAACNTSQCDGHTHATHLCTDMQQMHPSAPPNGAAAAAATATAAAAFAPPLAAAYTSTLSPTHSHAHAHTHGNGYGHTNGSSSSNGNNFVRAAAVPHSPYSHSPVPAHVAYAAHASAHSASSPSTLSIQVAPLRSHSASAATSADIRTQLQRYARATGHDSSSSDEYDDDDGGGASGAATDDGVDSETERLAMPPGPPSRAGRLRPRSRALAAFYLRLNRLLDVLPAWLDGCMRALGPALVLCAWLIFAGCSYVYFHCIVPAHGWELTSAPGLPITIFALSLLFQVYYNHIMAVITPPGGVPKDWVSEDQRS